MIVVIARAVALQTIAAMSGLTNIVDAIYAVMNVATRTVRAKPEPVVSDAPIETNVFCVTTKERIAWN